MYALLYVCLVGSPRAPNQLLGTTLESDAVCSRRTMSPINFGAAQLLEALKIFAPEKSEQLDDQLRAYLTGRLKRDDVIAVAQAVVGPEVMREALRKMVPGYDEMAKPAQEEAENARSRS